MKTELPVVLTPTRAESAQGCYRKHAISDILERGRGKSDPLAWGTVVHAGVGALHLGIEYRGEDRYSDALIATAIDALEVEYKAQGITGENEKYSWEKTKHSLRTYRDIFQRVGPFDALPDAEWKVLTVEDRVRLPVGDYILSFQIDRAYQSTPLSKIAVGDLKTVTSANAEWTSKWYRSLQMKLYKHGAHETYGTDLDDIMFFIEGLDKNKTPKLHYVMLPNWSAGVVNEAVEEFMRWAERDRQLLESAQALDSGGIIDMERLEELVLNHTSFNYGNCEVYHSKCDFYDLCHNTEPDMRRALLHAEYDEVPADY